MAEQEEEKMKFVCSDCGRKFEKVTNGLEDVECPYCGNKDVTGIA